MFYVPSFTLLYSTLLFTLNSVLGTPNEQSWPGISELPNYKPDFPSWPAVPLESVINYRNQESGEIVKCLDAQGLDLLQKMLVYEPGKRISAKQALLHPYFRDIQ